MRIIKDESFPTIFLSTLSFHLQRILACIHSTNLRTGRLSKSGKTPDRILWDKKERIVLNGRKVGNGDEACYDNCVAYFTKRGLTKRTILHELYHHLAHVNEWDMSERREESKANEYSRKVLKRA
jgi:hypothetical protein